MKRVFKLLISMTGLCFLLCACKSTNDAQVVETVTQMPVDVVKNQQSMLCVPTYITKINNFYFIVDCYHDQVIYNTNLEDPLTEWGLLSNDMVKPHTIASDGELYVIDDTEQHRIMVYDEEEGHFSLIQTFENIGNRPHYCIYREDNKTFYVWSSMSAEMFLFQREEDKKGLRLVDKKSVDSLNGFYERSFTILDNGTILIVSGDGFVYELDIDTFEVLHKYPVSTELFGMVQITAVTDGYLVTISTDMYANQDYATIIYVKSLEDLATNNYIDLHHLFENDGTPYNITKIEDRYYLTEHRNGGTMIFSFTYGKNGIENVTGIY